MRIGRIIAAATAIAAGAASLAPAAAADAAAGARIFDGREPVAGTIVGHSKPLPGTASRCSNCHEASARPKGGARAYGEIAKTLPPAKDPLKPAPGRSEPTPIDPDGTRNPYAAADAGASPFGPALNAKLLTRSIGRRGGPPSQYDEAAFCKVLRSGIDPADIVITRAMPRYTLDDKQCSALWHYLSRI